MEQGFDQPTGWGQRATWRDNTPGNHQIRLYVRSGDTEVSVGCACSADMGKLSAADADPWALYETHAPRPSRSTT